MSRDGSGIMSWPSGTAAVSGATIGSSAYNTFLADLLNDLNAARPITAGGTGATDAATALSNLGGQPIDATTTALAALSFTSVNNMAYATGVDTFSLLATTAAGRTILTYVDPNVDAIAFWDDSAGAFAGLTLGTGLSITTTTLNLSANLQTYSGITPSANVQTLLGSADYAAFRSNLSLGTAALKNTGTSGNNVPLLDGANTWSAEQTFGGLVTVPGTQGTDVPGMTGIVGARIAVSGATAGFTVRRDGFAEIGLSSGGSGALIGTWTNHDLTFYTNGTSKMVLSTAGALTLGGVAIPTISSSDTLSNKTLSSPTLSGTMSGGTFSGRVAQAVANTLVVNRTDSNAYKIELQDNGTVRGYIRASSTNAFEVLSSDTSKSLAFTQNGELIGGSVDPTSVYSLGYRGAPLGNGGSAANSAYTFVLADAGCTIYHDEVTARTYTIPANASVAYPIGTVIIIDNTGNSGSAGSITLAITSDTLRRGDGTSGTGSRTIAANQVAVIRKTKSTEWSIAGFFS